MWIAYDEELVPVKDGLQKVMPRMQLCNKFFPAVQGRIDWSTQPLFGTAQRWGEFR
jgi:hypothetical protein